MKTLLTVLIALTGLTVKAQQYQGSPDRKTSIYCYESEILQGSEKNYYVEIKTQPGRAADFIVVGTRDNNANPTVLLDQLIADEKGSVESGTVFKFISTLASGNLRYLKIHYALGNKVSNMLPSVLVVQEDGKHVAIPMYCTHMDKKASKK